MKKNDKIRERISDLFSSQKLAALSTHFGGQPYASLVAFFAAEDLRNLYFVTPRSTRKFANLKTDNRVALMINSSSNRAGDFHRAISVTAIGRAEEIDGSDKESILSLYLEKHPYLEDFVRSPTSALVRVSVTTYYMVRNFQNVLEMHITP
jgi:nitroimidazol reductase NimA-like FMN-containing flavoprotein (pyridoxamine 5'-phosphate oxidase superfamily)